MKPARPKLPRKARLHGKSQFIGAFPARRQGRYFTVLVRDNALCRPARIGMVIGRHAVPKAVGRSLMKRAIREVFRHLRGSLGSVDVVVRVRRPANRRELPEARHELENLLGKNR